MIWPKQFIAGFVACAGFGALLPVAGIAEDGEPTILEVLDAQTYRTDLGLVRLAEVDTPDPVDPKCESELRLGHEAKGFVVGVLASADDVAITMTGEVDKKERPLAKLMIDDGSIIDLMTTARLGYYAGNDPVDWCVLEKDWVR